jgi:uncharacterized damage-inducible protein DinB
VIPKRPWLARRFPTDLPNDCLPILVERLRGTPARVEDRVRGLPEPVRIARPGEAWSIQENIGHLLQVEDLWMGRLDDFETGKDPLRPAAHDAEPVEGAGFNGRPCADILAAFRTARARLIRRLEAAPDDLFARSALHPRLAVRMRIVDLAFFAAEHDDYHLARITEILAQGART